MGNAGTNSMAQDPLAQDSMNNDFYLQIWALNSPRSQETQLTRDMYIFEKNVSYFTLYVKIREKSTMKVYSVGH